MHKAKTDFLFAIPTSVSGAARALDLYGVYDLYNSSRSGDEADYKALVSDWGVIGQDISFAMSQFESSLDLDIGSHSEPVTGEQLSFFP